MIFSPWPSDSLSNLWGSKSETSKCNSEFNDLDGDKFHLHLLECGGVGDLLDTGKKKKKKRGMGGGLKSTVRMLKKSVSQDGNGTDTGKYLYLLQMQMDHFYFL